MSNKWKFKGVNRETGQQVWECRKSSFHLIFSGPNEMKLHCPDCKITNNKPPIEFDAEGRVIKRPGLAIAEPDIEPGMRILLCQWCGREFGAKRRGAKYCPDTLRPCRQQAQRDRKKS